MPKTVSEYLNEVDYEELKNYQPSQATLEFINFIQMCEDGKIENKTPVVHLVALDKAFSSRKSVAIMCHRGFAKTTIYAEMLFLFIACFGRLPGSKEKINFALYIADSIDNGVKSLRKNMEFRYQNSEFLKKMIPNTTVKYSDENGDDVDVTAGRKFTDVRIEFANVRGDHFIVRLYGAKTGVRGAKELGVRPQLAIIDDIISDEDARSETVISSIEDVIHKAVKYALHPKKHKVIWLGTPFNANDPLYKAVESGSYEVACFPVCEKFPCSKEEFRGSWEDRFDYEYVKNSYEEALSLGKVDSFYQELMLQIMSDENRIVKDEDIVWFKRNDILKYRHNYNFYITTDFATSEKSSADYSVISVWGVNNNGDYLLVEGMCKKQLMDKNIDKLFELASVYRPLGVGIEVTGQQKGFISWIQSEMIKRNIFFNLVSSNNNGQAGIRPSADKFARFSLFLPRIKSKKLWFAEELKGSEWMNEALDELSKASVSGFKSKHDDVIDTISMLGSFEVYKPSMNYKAGADYSKKYLPNDDELDKNNLIF
jgi:predicted phage terminase large subunit-like protein